MCATERLDTDRIAAATSTHDLPLTPARQVVSSLTPVESTMPITKSRGQSPSEQYLAKLCDKTFLSLWSYPNLYKAPGKELADIVVGFGQHILIFSDKECAYPHTADAELNWKRWFRRTVANSAKQLWGAERWLRQHPDKVFLDKRCKRLYPFQLNTSHATFHLIVVARGVAESCKAHFNGGSGSLLLHNYPRGSDAHTLPFHIGDLDSARTFVHVLDDTTLNIVMSAVDTIQDFVSYLLKKELLLRSDKLVMVTGEEDLLPHYLTRMKDGEHDFDFPDDCNGILITEGEWLDFCNHPQRIAQIKKNRISYMWDAIIEKFNYHALSGTQYSVSPGGIESSEEVLRFFASTTRFERRTLANSIADMIAITPPDECRRRVHMPLRNSGPYFVFVTFPRHPSLTESQNRLSRASFLEACCLVLRSIDSEAKDIVGFATESGSEIQNRSEDSIYLDGRHWSDELQKEAEELRRQFGIFTQADAFGIQDSEFPSVDDIESPKWSPRADD